MVKRKGLKTDGSLQKNGGLISMTVERVDFNVEGCDIPARLVDNHADVERDLDKRLKEAEREIGLKHPFKLMPYVLVVGSDHLEQLLPLVGSIYVLDGRKSHSELWVPKNGRFIKDDADINLRSLHRFELDFLSVLLGGEAQGCLYLSQSLTSIGGLPIPIIGEPYGPYPPNTAFLYWNQGSPLDGILKDATKKQIVTLSSSDPIAGIVKEGYTFKDGIWQSK